MRVLLGHFLSSFDFLRCNLTKWHWFCVSGIQISFSSIYLEYSCLKVFLGVFFIFFFIFLISLIVMLPSERCTGFYPSLYIDCQCVISYLQYPAIFLMRCPICLIWMLSLIFWLNPDTFLILDLWLLLMLCWHIILINITEKLSLVDLPRVSLG